MKTAVTVLAALALAACSSGKDAPGTPEARLGAPLQLAAAETAPARRVALDAANTLVFFQGAKVTRSHDGRFHRLGGHVDLDASGRVQAVQVEIDVASMETDTPKLTQHLLSPDFFDVKKFPVARFTSRAVEGTGPDVQVTGNLEIRGITRSITFPATIAVQADAVTVASEFMLPRREFGLVYPGMPDDLIRDDVLVRLGVRAPRGVELSRR